jgi:catechol 2,3-dioxygenase-like lactoylglutathione lyase family enzyme
VTFPNTGPPRGHCDDVANLWSGVDEEVIPVLYVEDAARAVSWYERLGFRKEWEHQFEPGFPWFLSVARGSVHLYFSEHKGDARPNTLIHLYVNDIDVVSHEFGIPSMKRVLLAASAILKIRMGTDCA